MREFHASASGEGKVGDVVFLNLAETARRDHHIQAAGDAPKLNFGGAAARQHGQFLLLCPVEKCGDLLSAVGRDDGLGGEAVNCITLQGS